MKKITFLVIAISLSFCVFAQKNTEILQKKDYGFSNNVKAATPSIPASIMDTACGNHPAYYTMGAGIGYITGTNKYADKEKAQKYTSPSGSNWKVTNVVALVISKNPTSTQNTTIKIYGVSSLFPSSLLGTSLPIKINAFAANNYTTYTFASPVALGASPKFAVSFVIPTAPTSDTTIVLSTQYNVTACTSKITDSLSLELSSDNTWHTLQHTYGAAPGIKIDLYLVPVLDNATSIDDIATIENVSLGQCYPNPAIGMTTINYELAQNANNVKITIMDVSGKVTNIFNEGNQSLGKHNVVFNASDLSCGVYFYAIDVDGVRFARKMIVE